MTDLYLVATPLFIVLLTITLILIKKTSNKFSAMNRSKAQIKAPLTESIKKEFKKRSFCNHLWYFVKNYTIVAMFVRGKPEKKLSWLCLVSLVSLVLFYEDLWQVSLAIGPTLALICFLTEYMVYKKSDLQSSKASKPLLLLYTFIGLNAVVLFLILCGKTYKNYQNSHLESFLMRIGIVIAADSLILEPIVFLPISIIVSHNISVQQYIIAEETVSKEKTKISNQNIALQPTIQSLKENKRKIGVKLDPLAKIKLSVIKFEEKDKQRDFVETSNANLMGKLGYIHSKQQNVKEIFENDKRKMKQSYRSPQSKKTKQHQIVKNTIENYFEINSEAASSIQNVENIPKNNRSQMSNNRSQMSKSKSPSPNNKVKDQLNEVSFVKTKQFPSLLKDRTNLIQKRNVMNIREEQTTDLEQIDTEYKQYLNETINEENQKPKPKRHKRRKTKVQTSHHYINTEKILDAYFPASCKNRSELQINSNKMSINNKKNNQLHNPKRNHSKDKPIVHEQDQNNIDFFVANLF